MHRKIAAFVFALLFVFFSVCGCEGKANPNDKETSETGFALTKENLSEYKIVIPDRCDDAVRNIATQLKSRIISLSGAEAEIKSDFVAEGSDTYRESEYEFLVGYVNRTAVAELYSDVRENDSGYAMIDKKVILIGRNAETLKNSYTLFAREVLQNAETKDVLMRSGEQKVVAGTYVYSQMTLNGTEIQMYRIIYPAASSLQEKKLASSVADYIKAKTGYTLVCESDRTEVSPHEIQIGQTNRITDGQISQRNASGFGENSYCVFPTANGVWLSGSKTQTLNSAINRFYEMFELKNGGVSLNIKSVATYETKSISVSALTYNIYHKFTSERNPDHVLQSIEEQNADIFGCNEANTEWITRLTSKLNATYTCIKGKNSKSDNSGDYCPIFYKKDMFDCEEYGTKWMSDTPDKVSKYDESHTQRVFTYAVLKEKTTGVRFLYVQVHFENNESGYDGATARKKQSAVLKSFTEAYSSLPIIIGGDCNTTSVTDLSPLLNNTRFINSSAVAEVKIESGTWVGSSFAEISGGVLDYFFITTDSITVDKYEAVDNKINGKYPSDHIPVKINAVIRQ